MIEFYLDIRHIHIGAVILSGLLFSGRGLGLIFSARWPRTAWARYLSYSIDTVLLTAALMLMTIVHQYPFADAWLTVKVVLLVVYIFLGICAFRVNQTRPRRIFFWLSALLLYGYIISVAHAHHPLGFIKLIQDSSL